ncbi:hypothetical protein [Flavobacterium luteolum]|uniref:hypothetical protein n=1 Tax=Flavobacterium luteolum TaxID=3003259 RepID=UPI00248E9171|nr:hypothetical protein [Flavobacterium luteolum]
MKFKFLFLCGILSLNSIIAQTVPSKPLNDVRTFEVTACKPSKNRIVAAWLEKRPNRKDNDESATNTRVAYKFSNDNGDNWTEKGIVDLPETFGTGNPYLTSNPKGDTFLAVMHIGKRFYEGNISIYEFNFEKKQFELKSIPIKSDNALLDKPAIAAFGDEIHLVYTEYPEGKNNSLKYQMSRDKGKTWTEPFTIILGKKVAHLSASITLLKDNQVAVSCGTYGGNKMYFIKKKPGTDANAFEAPIIVSKGIDNVGPGMSELSGYKNNVAMNAQNPHQPDQLWLSLSNDGGSKWLEPIKITEKGNLLSTQFDAKGNLHFLYTDYSNDTFSVFYKLFDKNNKIIDQKTIRESAPFKQEEYIGAFQKLLIQKSEYYCFWIDYVNNSELRFSKWK